MGNRVKDSLPAKASKAFNTSASSYIENNRHLAKNLSELREEIAEMARERNQLQEALLMEKNRANVYEHMIRDVAADCRLAMAQLVAFSNTFATIAEKLAQNNILLSQPVLSDKSANSTPKQKNSPTQKQKTKAVKPMVSGCTISKPTIKLSRISDQLLQAAVNGENVNTSENEERPEMGQLFVNITRLPERLNMDEMGDLETEINDEIVQQTEPAEDSWGPRVLSVVLENTEISSTTIRRLNEDSLDVDPPRFTTSTPHNTQPTLNDVPETSVSNTPPGRNDSLFITKRVKSRKSSACRNLVKTERCPEDNSQAASRTGANRNNGGDVKMKTAVVKVERMPTMRPKRSATVNVTYQEPSLVKKLRRK